jgi:replicative DNA helicase
MRPLREVQDIEVSTLKALAGDGGTDPKGAAAKVDAAGITSLDFANSTNRVLFDALMVQLRRGQRPEHLELINAVMGQAPQELVTAVVSGAEHGVLEPRLNVVGNAAAHRRLDDVLRHINGLSKLDGMPVGDIVTEALKALHTFQTPHQTLRTLDSEVLGLVDEVEEIAAGRRLATLHTGIAALDELVGGLPTTLTVIGSMPGAGKSALLARLVRNIAERGMKVGVFSLEDQSRWLVRRLVAESAPVPVFVLQNRRLDKCQLADFGAAAEKVYALAQHVLVDDRKGLSTQDIITAARVMVTRHGVKAIFVDHLGEIRLGRSDRHDLDIADCLRDLRAIADVYRVPIVVLCHVKRRQGLEAKDAPTVTDFAFSAGVERMARLAIGLSYPREDVLGVHVLKQTQGKCDVSVMLRFNAPAGMATNEESVR